MQVYKAKEIKGVHGTNDDLADNGWAKYTTKPMDVYLIDGDHASIHFGQGLEQMCAHLNLHLKAEQKIVNQLLAVPHAFNSPLMNPVVDEFVSFIKQFEFNEPTIPMVSSVTGRLLEPGQLSDVNYWAKQILAPVKFAKGVESMVAHDIDVFLEIGADASLSRLCKTAL